MQINEIKRIKPVYRFDKVLNFMRKVVIVDYGLGNILSVKNAFSMFEKNTLVSNDYMEIKNASHLIVPGVGSFSEGITNCKTT